MSHRSTGAKPWLLWGLLAASSPGIAVESVPAPERQAQLQHLLTQDCGSCHGLRLAGGLGPPLLPEALANKPIEYLVAVILHGQTGTAMPPWRPLLSPADATWLARTLKGEVP